MWSGCLEGFCVCVCVCGFFFFFFFLICSWNVGISLCHTPSPCSSPSRIIIPLVYFDTLHLVNLSVHLVTSLSNIDVLCLPQVEV